jgi:hypothetical protein
MIALRPMTADSAAIGRVDELCGAASVSTVDVVFSLSFEAADRAPIYRHCQSP